jgi:starch-binding outer membrane protein, SusD/RagB family
MKMKNIKIYIITLFTIAFVSCKKQIEVEPRQSILVDQVFTSKDNINAAIVGIYARLKSPRLYGRDFFAVSDALSENGFATNKSGRLVNEAALTPGAHFVNFQLNYYSIAEINTLLTRLPSVTLVPAITTAERAFWEGQLYFLRALNYHDLARTYCYEPGVGVAGQDRGGIPIVTSTPLTIEGAIANLPARPSVDSVYRRIYMDLDSALVKLTNPASSNPSIATLDGARALYARVALYNRDYNRAITMSNLVLTNFLSKLSTTATYIGDWSIPNHRESVFEIRYLNPAENIGVNESLQTTFTTLKERSAPLVLQGFGDLVPTTTLLQQLGFGGIAANGSGGTFTSRTDDVRNLLFEGGNTGRGPARIECTKFIGKNGQPNLDNVPIIRAAEVLLTRAEARANATNRDGSANAGFSLANAMLDLIALKQNRYSSYATTQSPADVALQASVTAAPIISEILRQRRLEFAMEGQRWFDYKRTGGITGTGLNTKVVYTDFRMLAGLPQREVDGNPNLIQNFGY